MSAAPIYGLLLSGGASRRMQRDKAQLSYAGEPQLLRAWRLLSLVTERAFVSVRDTQCGDPLRAGLPQLVDTYDAIGPAAGILSAQDAHPDAAWLVMACDLPLLDETTLRALMAARDPRTDATAFSSRFDGLPEPLCALWEPSSHGLLKQRYEAGSFCPRKALMQSSVTLLPAPGAALDNINTPEEFEQMQRQLGVAAMIEVTLQYYAQLREQAGVSSEQVSTRAANLRELYDELSTRHGFSLPIEALKVAVNAQFSDWNRLLGEGDTIVFIPPVAGG